MTGLIIACVTALNMKSETDYTEALPYSYASPSGLESITGGVVGNGGMTDYSETLEITYTKPKDKIVKIAASSQTGIRPPLDSESIGGVAARSKWTASTYEIHRRLVALGYDTKLATYMIDACKSRAQNPRHCIVTMGFIGTSESQAGSTAYKNNIFGFRDTAFATRKKAVDAWMDTYVRKWYKTK